MFLTCNMCKHSEEYLKDNGAPEDDLYKCKQTTPSALEKNKMGEFPIVHKDWECDEYRKEMGS